MNIPIEVSARHVHLSKEDLEVLFGLGYELTNIKQLTQTCDFAAKEQVDIKVGFSNLSKVRVVGPIRKETQVELSLTDAISLGINPPIRVSGDLKDAINVTLVGPAGKVEAGVIIAQRHLHCNPSEAKKLGLKNNTIVSVLVKGDREIVFNKVKVRVGDGYKLCLHLDTDEGNAAGINKIGEGSLI